MNLSASRPEGRGLLNVHPEPRLFLASQGGLRAVERVKHDMDRISGIVVLLLGAAILWQGRHLTIGSLRSPGPGFFPALLAGVMIILALFLIVPRKKKDSSSESSSFPSIGRVSIVFIALLFYFYFLESLGFIIVSFFLMTFLFIVVASEKWHLALLQSFIFVGLAYVLFDVLLKSQLPHGVIGF